MSELSPWIPIGRLGRAKGLKGEIYADLYNSETESLESGRAFILGDPANNPRSLSLEDVYGQGSRVVLKFTGIDTPEGAKELVGLEFFVSRDDLPKLKAGEHYVRDLIGFSVINEKGEILGQMKGVISTSSNDVYVVEGPRGEILLPAISSVLRKIDLQSRRMEVILPEVVDAV